MEADSHPIYRSDIIKWIGTKFISRRAVVLAIVQEKVNNPSSDDPFDPEIAAVRVARSSVSVA